jgi:murein DD-endopeptidase MepM/ murein hydrolase activator NlpD
MHTGIDIGAGFGAPIRAAKSGVVISVSSSSGGYGMLTVIDHGGGFSTLYGHQSRFAVSGGETVTQGQVIGYVGCSGHCTGPHLHFETRVNGTPQNPMNYLP